jgi:hypothetical protein
MAIRRDDATRRAFLTMAGPGLAATLGPARAATAAAEATTAEKVNMTVVSDFCAAFAADDVDSVIGVSAIRARIG